MLTDYQIAEFTRRARLAGLTDEQIRQEIERKVREMGGTTSPVALSSPQTSGAVTASTTTTPTFSSTSKKQTFDTTTTPSSGSGVGSFVVNFVKGLIEPAVEYGKFVGEAAYQAGRFAFSPEFRKSVLGEKLSKEELEKLSKQKATLFYSEEEAQRKLGSREKIAETGLKATAGAESYFVPFGRGTSLMSKVFIPGAAVGALSEVSREEATPESVAESAVFGAATAGVLHGIGGMLSWVRGKNGELIRQSEKIAEGTRKIKVKPSVFGAKQEKAINQTLDKYGFKGSAQEQYEMLEPVMNQIEKKIQGIIKENPKLGVSIEDIKNAFLNNLKGSMRTRDLTQKQAITEINGYLNDLLLAAKEEMGEEGTKALTKWGIKKIDLGTLREMKKILNQDYASVFKKIENGTSLNPREKVIAAAWDSLDEAIKNVSPELKELLVDESNLYRAAQPLASARFNPPTFRIAGTSMPASLTQKLRDLGQSVLKKLGMGAEKLPEGKALQKPTLEKLAAMTPAVLRARGLTDEEIQQVENLKSSITPTLETQPQQQTMQPLAEKPSPLNPFGGLSKRQVLALALSSGASAKDLEEVGKIYDMLAPEDSTAVTEENMKIVDSLRTEYFKRSQENNWVDILNSYEKVINTTETPAGDVSLIFAFMKMLDPGSVVREGEFATAENTAGVPEQIRRQYNRLLKGDRLSEKQRIAYKNEARRVFQVYQQRQANIDAYYQGLAKRYGVDPSLLGVGLYQENIALNSE